MNYAIIDASGGAKCGDGTSVTPLVLAQMAQVLAVFLNRDVGAVYGSRGTVRPAASAADLLAGEVPITIDASLSVQGAIAYHTDVSGAPVIEDAVTLSSSLMGPGNSVLCALSHEIAETEADPGCNRIALTGTGDAVACEVCDPVESDTYPITPRAAAGVVGYVSNFVLPSWFDPNGVAPFDFKTSRGLAGAQSPSAPFKINGGYAVVYSSLSDSSQVTAMGDPKGRTGRVGRRAARRRLK